MKFDNKKIESIAKYLGFANVSNVGTQVQFSCPLVMFPSISKHKHNDKNASFYVSQDKSNPDETRWTCAVCEKYYYPSGIINKAETVQYSYRTEDFLLSLTHLYNIHGYRARAQKTMGVWFDLSESDAFSLSNSSNENDVYDPYAEIPYVPFSETWLSSFPSVIGYPKALEYLKTRSISLDVAMALDLRFDASKNLICFPMRDYKTQAITGLRGRNIIHNAGTTPKLRDNILSRNKHFWYLNGDAGKSKDPWLNEHSVDFSKPIIVVEGIFDLLKVAEVYPNVIAACTKTACGSKIARIRHAHSLIWLTDNGSAENNRKDIMKHCDYLKIPYYDLFIPQGYTHITPDGQEEEVKDAGALPTEVLKPLVLEAVENAIKLVKDKKYHSKLKLLSCIPDTVNII